jgi:putative DNA primase/helicase
LFVAHWGGDALATIQEFLALLKDVKQNGSGFMAKCPVHDDWEGSLAISEGDDGRILLNCFAGCETRDIVAAVGLKMKDLFPNNKPFQNKGARRQDKPFTVEDLAKDKGLPVPFLESLGVQNIGNGVKITYYTAQGKPNTKQRFRWSLAEKPVWSKKGKTVICYGGWRIKEMAEKHDYMIFVEGESDSWTLWHHDLPAIGVPGADMGKLIAIGHIKPFDRVYIWKEHGKSGETFLKSVPSRLAKLGYQGEVFMIQSP